MIPGEWIEEAGKRIGVHIVETPLTWDRQRGIYIKWENHQVTGSFKARGALNKVLSLADWERAAGIVAVSAGNHGQGVALAAGLVHATVEVFVPKHTGQSKIETMRRLGAVVHVVDGGYAEAERVGREYAARNGKAFVSPYNDGQVIAGQGTLALECMRQVDHLRSSVTSEASPALWLVPTGGGGLISGCGAALARGPEATRLVGVQAAASPFAHSLFHRGTQEGIEDKPTLAEGLSGAVEEDSLTIPLMRRYVSDLLLVSEEEIRKAIAFAWRAYGERVEGSGAAGLAVILAGQVSERPALVIVTGGNIEPDLHDSIVAEHRAEVRS